MDKNPVVKCHDTQNKEISSVCPADKECLFLMLQIVLKILFGLISVSPWATVRDWNMAQEYYFPRSRARTCDNFTLCSKNICSRSCLLMRDGKDSPCVRGAPNTGSWAQGKHASNQAWEMWKAETGCSARAGGWVQRSAGYSQSSWAFLCWQGWGMRALQSPSEVPGSWEGWEMDGGPGANP